MACGAKPGTLRNCAEAAASAAPLDTPAAVIDALGGTASVAAALEINASAVSQWRLAGIPARRFAALEALAVTLEVPGVSMQSLAALAAMRVRHAAA